MSRQEKLENLTTAYYLEDTLLILNRELNELNRNMPRAPKQPLKPTEPMEMEPQKVQLIQYPQIQPPQIKHRQIGKRTSILHYWHNNWCNK